MAGVFRPPLSVRNGCLYVEGVPFDDVVGLGRAALGSPHAELVGVHVHLARQTADLGLWRAQLASFADLLGEKVERPGAAQ